MYELLWSIRPQLFVIKHCYFKVTVPNFGVSALCEECDIQVSVVGHGSLVKLTVI